MDSHYKYNTQIVHGYMTEFETNNELIKRIESAKRMIEKSSFLIDIVECNLIISECKKCLKQGNYTHGIFPYWELGEDRRSFVDKITGEIIWRAVA